MNQPAKSILLVDDDQEIRELLDTYLSRAGFQVRAVANGEDFRRALCDEESALAILDVMLPDEDGFSLCRWIRSHQRHACMPVIMLTASSDEADRVVGLELGADDYLGKPFSPASCWRGSRRCCVARSSPRCAAAKSSPRRLAAGYHQPPAVPRGRRGAFP